MGANASKKNKLKAKDIQELAEKTKCKSPFWQQSSSIQLEVFAAFFHEYTCKVVLLQSQRTRFVTGMKVSSRIAQLAS